MRLCVMPLQKDGNRVIVTVTVTITITVIIITGIY